MASKFEKAFKDLEKEATTPQAPRGYKLVREAKTTHINILTRPSTREALDEIRAERGQSRNELINDILERYVEEYYNER